jgi:hypothetical protein
MPVMQTAIGKAFRLAGATREQQILGRNRYHPLRVLKVSRTAENFQSTGKFEDT